MKEGKIFIPIWNAEITIIYGNQEDVSEYFKVKHDNLDVSKYVSTNGNHFTVVDNNKSVKIDYLVLYEGYENMTIIHESGHLAWEILHDRLVSVDYENQEPLFYLQDYIASETIKTLEQWIDQTKIS